MHRRRKSIVRKLMLTTLSGGGVISGSQRLQSYLDAINANKVGNMRLFLALNEDSGTQATDYSGNDYHASYFGASLTVNAVTGPLLGNAAPDFGGTANAIDIDAAGWLAQATGFNGKKGHLSIWLYSTLWGDTTGRYIAKFFGTSSSRSLIVEKTATANQARITYRHTGGISIKSIDVSSVSSSWFNLQVSWQDDDYDSTDNDNGVVAAWVNNTAQTPNLTITGVFDDASINSSNGSLLGANLDNGASLPWDGSIALFSVFDDVQDSTSRAALYNLPGGIQT